MWMRLSSASKPRSISESARRALFSTLVAVSPDRTLGYSREPADGRRGGPTGALSRCGAIQRDVEYSCRGVLDC